MAENQDQNGVDQASVVSQVARMLSIVLKNTEVQGAVQTQPAIETGAASFLENTLISRTLNRLGIRVTNNTTPAELAESDVDRQRQEAVREPTTQTIQSQNSSEIDSQLATLPNAILEEVQQTNELSEEDIETLKNLFPALFNRALDSHPDIHVVNLPFPDTRPVAGFDTTSIYSGRVFLDDEIQIINTDPLASNDFLSVTEDSISVQIDVLANDRDADNDVLTVTAASASNGIITINANGTLSYTPTANFTGTDTISYTISDGNGGISSAKVVVVVTAVNDAPVAVDDIATVVKDSNNNTITVLTNDVDLDGDTLTVTSASATNGTVSINVDGTLSYTPTANFTGTDTISYAISDGNGGSSSADVTVAVTAVNDAPVAVDDVATVSEDSNNNTITVLTNDVDLDGDTLTVTSASATNGTVSINVDGTLSYTPTANFTGTDTISYAISDGNGGSSSADVTVVVSAVNDAPVAVDDVATVSEDSTNNTITVLTNDVDLDGDTLTVTSASATNGTVSINVNGTLSYTPTANFTGTDTISYAISDGNGGSSSADVTVAVTAVNDAPVAVDDVATVSEDSTNNTITVLTNDVDLDGDTLTVTSASATNGTVSINVNGTLSYTPTANFTGTDTISYAISDGNGGSSSADVTVAVSAVNDAPDISNESTFISETSINPSTSVSGTLTFNDVDGDALVFTLSEPVEQIYSAGNLVTWVGGNTQTVIGSALGNEVLRATIDNSGNYTITLSDAIDHPDTVTQDTLNLTIDVNATDGVATSVGELTVTVEDDVPTVSDSSTLFTIDGANLTATGNVFGASGEYGSDGGFVSTVKIGGYNYSYDASTNGVSQSGYSEVVSGYSYDTFNHELTINTYKGEMLVVDVLTGDYNYSTSGVSGSPASTPSDPVVSSSDSGGLLGIVGADLLGIIDFSTNQAVTAYDADNDITQVIVRADQAISLSLGAYYELSFSTELANEFGLTLSLTDDKADVLGVTTQTFSQLTITATDGGSIDNSALNEFLATLYIEQFGLLNLALTPSMSISATDSRTVTVTDASIDLLGLSLLGTSSIPAEIQHGTNADDVMTGSASDDRIYGYSGSDNLSGLSGNDLLRGGAGSDTLNGGSGNDILVGGAGSDLLSGGTGIDVFKWEEGDLGGTDQITDFDTNPLTTGGDILDLRTLLNGEGSIGASAGNLTNYLHFELSGVDTVIYISSNGSFSGGYNPAFVDHTIVINNNDLVGNDDDQHIIEALLKSGKLIVDEADNSTSMLAGYTEVDYVITDGDGDIDFHESIFDSSGKSDEVANSNTAPYVQVSDETLLGLVGLSALNLIDFSDQDINAGDVDGNLQSVNINYTALLGLGAYSLTASSSLAAELGLQIDKVDDSGLLGLVNPSSTLVITAIDGGTIDNQAINELLATVNFENGGGLIPQALLTLNVLNATTVTTVDDLGASMTQSVASLADINALDSLAGNANIHVGTAGNDVISASVENNRLYGYAGDDQLSGGQGADLLRGGSGNDQLIGDADNDLIIGGTGDDQLTGGIGIDVFRWEKGDEGTTLVPSNDTVTDFSVNEDVLDFSSVLINEENGDITHYLDFNFDGSDTVISVSIDGVSTASLNVSLTGVDVTAANTLTNQQIIDSLILSNQLIIDS